MKNLIHRDIKPGNFAMSLKKTEDPETLYLIDFGIAKYFKDDKN